MVNFEAAREAVYQLWLANWTATPAGDWTFAGEVYDPPPDRPWARLTVRNRTGGGQTLGGAGERRFIRQAAIFVNVFVPINSGEGALDPLIQAVCDAFEAKSFGQLRTFAADPRETGPDRGIWNTAVVEIPFDFHETK